MPIRYFGGGRPVSVWGNPDTREVAFIMADIHDETSYHLHYRYEDRPAFLDRPSRFTATERTLPGLEHALERDGFFRDER